MLLSLFFFNDTATPEIYTLSLTTLFRSTATSSARRSGATSAPSWPSERCAIAAPFGSAARCAAIAQRSRSEEHTSELQSQFHLVCRLLLEKKKGQLPHRSRSSSPQCRGT